MPLQPHVWQPSRCSTACHGCFNTGQPKLCWPHCRKGITAHLVGNLRIALQEEDRQEQRHKGQEREQFNVVLPTLLLLEVPAGQCNPVPANLSCWRSLCSPHQDLK